MKIAILMPLGDQRGGGELMLWHLLKYGNDKGIEWVVIFQEDGPLVQRVTEANIKTRVIKSGRLRQTNRFVLSILKIAVFLHQEKVNALINWMPKAQLYGSPAAFFARIPSLWFQLGFPTGLLDRVATRLPAIGIFTLSHFATEKQSALSPRRTMRMVYPGVELDQFNSNALCSPRLMRQHLHLPSEGPLIGIVGRLQKWKGMHLLIKAMPQILKSYPQASCVIVGDEVGEKLEYQTYLKQIIQELNLKDRIHFVGLQQNVAEWMQAMDVVVHASIEPEPFGIVVIEALALGKPVVAADAGGPTEVIRNGENGLLTPSGNVNALALAILRYLDNPAFAQKVGTAARETALQFSVEKYVENFVHKLHEMLTGQYV